MYYFGVFDWYLLFYSWTGQKWVGVWGSWSTRAQIYRPLRGTTSWPIWRLLCWLRFSSCSFWSPLASLVTRSNSNARNKEDSSTRGRTVTERYSETGSTESRSLSLVVIEDSVCVCVGMGVNVCARVHMCVHARTCVGVNVLVCGYGCECVCAHVCEDVGECVCRHYRFLWYFVVFAFICITAHFFVFTKPGDEDKQIKQCWWWLANKTVDANILAYN